MYNYNGLKKTFKEGWDMIILTIIAFTTAVMIYECMVTILYAIGKTTGTTNEIDSIYYQKTGKHLPTY